MKTKPNGFYRFIGRVAGILLPSLLGLVAALFMGEATMAKADGPGDLQAGIQAAERKDYVEAIRLYTKAITSGELSGKKLSWAFSNRCFARTLKGDNDAVADCDETIKLNPENEDAYTDRGLAKFYKKDLVGALADFNQAIRLSPQDPTGFGNRCFLRATQGTLKNALADCNEALRLDPRYADAFNGRGLIYLKAHKYTEAIAEYNAALKIDADSAEPLYGRGITRRLMGDTKGAEADIAAALKIDADVATTYKLYGVPSN